MIQVIINAPKDCNLTAEKQGLWQINLLKLFSQTGIANFLARQQGLPDGNWVLISPVHCQTTHNDAMIIGNCKEPEWQSTIEVYYEHFVNWVAQDGIMIHRLEGCLWLMNAQTFPDLATPSLQEVQHRSLSPFLSNMPSFWLKWWTEVQMVLHQVKVQGPYVVNAVWPWGAGTYVLKNTIFVLSKNHLYHQLLKANVPVEVWQPHVKLNGKEVFLIDADEQHLWEQLPINQYDSHWWWLDTNEEKPGKTLWNALKEWLKREY